ncbi:MAG: PilZ domain-containing protein [Bdellovibrionota bacterium]
MGNPDTSVIALIIADERRAPAFERVFKELLDTHVRTALKGKLNIERFKTVGEFLRAQRDRKNLSGTVIDAGIVSDASDIEKRAFMLLEELQIPILKVSEKMVEGDAVDRKILTGKWMQLMEQVEAFAPRGLRVHSRKLCYIKIRYLRAARRPGESGQVQMESKAITYDLSPGGCFIVSMDDWTSIDEISIFIGDHPDAVPCRIRWKLPWGASPWKMPGIGVEFVTTDETLKTYLAAFLKEG